MYKVSDKVLYRFWEMSNEQGQSHPQTQTGERNGTIIRIIPKILGGGTCLIEKPNGERIWIDINHIKRRIK